MSHEPLRLLVLDGEPGWGTALLDGLSSHGLSPLHCSDPQQAEACLQQPDSPDLIVIDLAIGVPQSQRFSRWLRERSQPQPVLAVGALLDEGRRVQLLESWADDVLNLPLSLPEFVARCRALWRRHQLRLAQWRESTHTTRLRHGEIEMLVEEHAVWRAGEPVSLTPREFRLLEYLLRHPGQVLDRDTLLERVWGEMSSLELDPKTVDVHIRWLRIKLERDAASPQLITTERGRGYRLG
jgi:two-component system phosphate regulon response regulator PhoB